MVNKNTISIGKINSADERPNQIPLNALPLLLLKYLDIVVDEVCDISPWPENLIKKIATNKKATDDVLEKKKEEKDKSIVTKIANFITFTSSIFFPIQIRSKLLNRVADA